MDYIFIVDVMLGKLSKWLRIIGYEALYNPFWSDEDIIVMAEKKKGIIVTRDTKLKAQGKDIRIVYLKENSIQNQLAELMDKLRITVDNEKILSRCIVCNGMLQLIKKNEVEGMVPEYVFLNNEYFYRCNNCSKIYWSGSHTEDIYRKLKEMFPGQIA